MWESTAELLRQFRAGNSRACARIISLVEDDAPAAVELLDAIYPYVGQAYRVGITGPPGAGKSTLVEKLVHACRKQNRKIGIVAVDPTSPFSGGAILGDRVRMSSLFMDPGVFIRSMATRGGTGGLASRTKEVCDVLDAFGTDWIFVETVGVGQVELDIASAAHTTLVVLVPESGDSIQVMKAGLMEVGDVFCVNKSDRQGADGLVVALESVLEQKRGINSWIPPVIKTTATTGEGVEELLERLDAHRKHLLTSKTLERLKEAYVRNKIRELVELDLLKQTWSRAEIEQKLSALVQETMQGKTTPYRAAAELLLLLRADRKDSGCVLPGDPESRRERLECLAGNKGDAKPKEV